MSNATIGQTDQRVKAGWLAIGLSQTDLAEILDAAFQQSLKGANGIGTARLMQVAEALDMRVDFARGQAGRNGQEPDISSGETQDSLPPLLELRLLRAFHELSDHRTKRMLVYLAEQILKRQANRCGDGSEPDSAS
jgi:hypothetical protein